MSPLAGPIVRRVLPDSATVWLALENAAQVTLDVYDGDTIVATGTRETIMVLPEVHVVAVMARGELRWGKGYTYGLRVDGQPMDLAAFALAGARPGFRLLSDDLTTLRLLHGSCRKPHGPGIDALELVHDLLLEKNPPQALFLTGDQIYADDVHPELLAELAPTPIADRARHVKDAGFTSGAAANHLVELHEFVLMYVRAWTSSDKVRKVLANVATWMMFDDHDVTDDWRLDGSWVAGLTDEGRRIEQNALRAYAYFQHWGNAPDRDPREFQGWGWQFDTPLFRCVSLDTRTRRHYPAPKARSGLMRDADVADVLSPHGRPFTLVISPPPVLGQALVEALQTASRPFTGNAANDQEAWSGDRTSWENLLGRMSRLRNVLVLSGDVHFGFLARVAGKLEPFEIVNATASALRNETGGAKVLALLGGVLPSTSLQAGGEDRAVVHIGGERLIEELAGAGPGGGITTQAAHKTTTIVADNHVGDIRFGDGFVRQRYVTGKPNAPEHTARFGVDITLQAVPVSGEPAARIAAAIEEGAAPAPEEIAAVLSVLRAFNRFEDMREVAEVAEGSGLASAHARILHAQALIEGQRITDAIEILRGIKPGGDIRLASERAGLLGRAYKQRWIDARPNAAEPQEGDLVVAVNYYGLKDALDSKAEAKGEEDTRPDTEWLLVNQMALRHAATRLTGRFADPGHTEDVARELLAIPLAPDDPWALANRGEAALVLGDAEAARTWFEAYLEHPRITAFHARGTLRQLTELYGLDPTREPGRTLLPRFEATILQKGGTGQRIDLSPARIGHFPPDQGDFQPLSFLRDGLERARSVGRIEVGGRPIGTAFVVNLGRAREGWDEVLLTNAHVCADAAGAACHPSEARVRFFYPDGTERDFGVRQLWTSPIGECDATVLRIDGDPGCDALEPWVAVPEPSPRTLVNVIGHPAGLDTQVSAQDNQLERVDGRCLWYRAGTAGGSSGSPVFDNRWRLIGLHHARSHDLRLNEGIRLDHILRELSPPEDTRQFGLVARPVTLAFPPPPPGQGIEAQALAADIRGLVVRVSRVKVHDTHKEWFWESEVADVYPIFLLIAGPSGPSALPISWASLAVYNDVPPGGELTISADLAPTIYRSLDRLPTYIDLHVLLMRSKAKTRDISAAIAAAVESEEGKALVAGIQAVVCASNPAAGAAIGAGQALLTLVGKVLSKSKDRQLFYTVASFERTHDLGIGLTHRLADANAEVDIRVEGVRKEPRKV